MFYRLDREVDVEIRPVEMVRARKLDVHEFSDRHIAKPRELLERKKQFPLADEDPEAVPRNVTDLDS